MKPFSLVMIFFLTLFFSCGDKGPSPKGPTVDVATTAVTNVTLTTASSGGTITSDGGDPITARGICWSINANPTISLSTKTTDGSGTGTFVSALSNLLPAIYYVRAYATNSKGTFYGNQLSFNVNDVIPKLTTKKGHNLTSSSVESGGTITSDGGNAITARGVCWSASSGPTVDLITKTTDGSGTGSFNSSITGLTTWEKYYVRAYVVNSVGTFYGNELIEVAIPTIAYSNVNDIDGNSYKTIVIGTATWMAENLRTTKYQDGSSLATPASNAEWINSSEGAYTEYDRQTANASKFGFLYNGKAVTDPRKVCPAGWHIPSSSEWIELGDNLGGQSVAGGRLKDLSEWTSPNLDADNASGFSGLPGGSFYSSGSGGNGIFSDMGTDGYWWSSDVQTFYYLTNNMTLLRTKSTALATDGLSIRCVKD